jgi:ubiquinone/menaquinone biosynthesis C-methylase UbiE
MQYDEKVAAHYAHGDLLNAIRSSLGQQGKSIGNITIEDLGPVDEFHIGGRQATSSFLGQFEFSDQDHILDVGCGLGGSARYVASQFGARVTGIDLTQEYVDTGNVLCGWVNLDKQISLSQGSALSMPFEDESFNAAYMMHVAMNIENKAQLFEEIYRVLRPGASFGVYDVMRSGDGELSYPVPWATEKSTSNLAAPDEYREALVNAGFEVSLENNRRDFALSFFKQLREQTEARDGPPPLGLHTLMQESTGIKIQNMVHNITEGYIAPVEIFARKSLA